MLSRKGVGINGPPCARSQRHQQGGAPPGPPHGAPLLTTRASMRRVGPWRTPIARRRAPLPPLAAAPAPSGGSLDGNASGRAAAAALPMPGSGVTTDEDSEANGGGVEVTDPFRPLSVFAPSAVRRNVEKHVVFASEQPRGPPQRAARSALPPRLASAACPTRLARLYLAAAMKLNNACNSQPVPAAACTHTSATVCAGAPVPPVPAALPPAAFHLQPFLCHPLPPYIPVPPATLDSPLTDVLPMPSLRHLPQLAPRLNPLLKRLDFLGTVDDADRPVAAACTRECGMVQCACSRTQP
jgi:hypothetical protein